MVIKLAEWAGMELLAIALARFFMMVSGRDDDDMWECTVSAEKKALRILGIDEEGTAADV